MYLIDNRGRQRRNDEKVDGRRVQVEPGAGEKFWPNDVVVERPEKLDLAHRPLELGLTAGRF